MDKREFFGPTCLRCSFYVLPAIFKNFNNEDHAYGTVADKYGVIVAEAGK